MKIKEIYEFIQKVSFTKKDVVNIINNLKIEELFFPSLENILSNVEPIVIVSYKNNPTYTYDEFYRERINLNIDEKIPMISKLFVVFDELRGVFSPKMNLISTKEFSQLKFEGLNKFIRDNFWDNHFRVILRVLQGEKICNYFIQRIVDVVKFYQGSAAKNLRFIERLSSKIFLRVVEEKSKKQIFKFSVIHRTVSKVSSSYNFEWEIEIFLNEFFNCEDINIRLLRVHHKSDQKFYPKITEILKEIFIHANIKKYKLGRLIKIHRGYTPTRDITLKGLFDISSSMFRFKIIFHGKKAGKTTIIRTLCKTTDYISPSDTPGKIINNVVFPLKTVDNSDIQNIEFEFTEIGENIIKSYSYLKFQPVNTKDYDGHIIVFSMVDKPTFKNVETMIELLRKNDISASILVVGTKIDMFQKIQVSDHELKNFSVKNKVNICLSTYKIIEEISDLLISKYRQVKLK